MLPANSPLTRSTRSSDSPDVPGTSDPEGPRDPGSALLRDPVASVAVLVAVLALGIRVSVLKDSYFITDDFMLSARAMESPWGWDYATRVHTGHFEPIGFTVMWLLAHLAPLSWPTTVVVLLLGQVVLLRVSWTMLRELFGRNPLVLVPFSVLALTPLTLPAFNWLAAAIIWLPLMIGMAGAIRWHARYVRTGQWPHALRASAWFVVMLCSFEKALVFLPFVVVLTVALRPDVPTRVRALVRLLWSRWHAWVGYLVPLVAYLVVYLPGVRGAGNDSPVTAPKLGTLSDFVFLSLFRTFIPGVFGGPWQWQPTSYGLAIVDSPRAFDWACWIAALAVVVVSVLGRRGAARHWVALLTYLAGSVAAIAAGRVAFGGSIVALETRYLADATIPLLVALGAAIMPLRHESRPWTPWGRSLAATVSRRARLGVAAGSVLVLALVSLHAMDGYAGFSTRNPYRGFVETTKTSLAKLPREAQIYDTLVPGDVIGAWFGRYNLVSRFVSPFLTERQRKDLYTRRSYSDPYVLAPTGELVPLKVAAAATSVPRPGSCYVVSGGTVTVPLTGSLFPWGWVARIGYLADRPVSGTVVLGAARETVPFPQGLGQVYVSLTGSGSELEVRDLPDGVNFCVGDIEIGSAEPGAKAS